MANEPIPEVAEIKTSGRGKKTSLALLKGFQGDAAYNALNIVIVLILWTGVSAWVNSPYVPAPAMIWKATVRLYRFGDVEGFTLYHHITASIIRIMAGFGLACLMGIPLGILMGLYPKLYARTRAIIEPIRFIPPIAWIPMSIVILIGFSRYVFLIWLGAFFPIWINTLAGVGRVNQVFLSVAKVFGGDKKARIRKIVIPSVMPDITSGMRVGLGMAWMCIVAAEMIGGEAVGVGRLILKYAELLQLAPVISGMLIIGLIGFFMNEVLLRVERKLFKWRWEVSL
jgi:ABC-type nitrate/sulfonate/bicarbonate transport system permease component